MCRDKSNFGSTVAKCAMAPYECEPYSQDFFSAREVLVNPLSDCRLCAYDVALTSGVDNQNPKDAASLLEKEFKKEEHEFHNGEVSGLAIGSLLTLMLILIIGFLAYVLRSDKAGTAGPQKHANFGGKSNGPAFVKVAQEPIADVPAIS